ncbi:MAG: hypothetical protein L3J19_00525 [Sulfurimonas sp.]|nr:hypothetical protein [Sulfurimonas sp.]
MIAKFLEALYTKVFINIIVENTSTIVYIEICSRDDVIDSIEKSFDTTSINAKIYDFIKSYSRQSPFCYISVLDNSPLQGAIPTSVSSEMNKYVDMSSVKYIALKDWAVYTPEYDINAVKHEYRSIGIDFIFSPFLIMFKFFKDKIDSTLSMFVLVEDNYLSLSVFDNSKLLYGEYHDMDNHKDDELLMDSSLDEDDISLEIEGIDLDEIDIDNDIDSLDDFANIEDLDISGDIDEFSEAQDIEEIIHAHDEDNISSDGFNEDYQRFLLIQSSLSSFYKDDKYESKFIENIYIADGVGVSSDLKGYLEEEMFLSVYVRKINLGASVCNMAKAELNEI